MKSKKFHQFVVLEKGPVNTAIVDLLKGDVYQIGNEIVDKFLEGNDKEIPDFIRMLEEEALCFDVDPEDWIPYITFEQIKDDSFHIQCEDESSIPTIQQFFRDYDYTVSVSVSTPADKDFNRCIGVIKCGCDFGKVNIGSYHFNNYYNSCWGKKIIVMKDGTIKPCIHSRITIGNIFKDDLGMMVNQSKEYWKLTKDKVEKCRDCELRYACFDCREIAWRKGGKISSSNPFCRYDPYTGHWMDQEET
ncbi:MAG TPA: SPASM domain-containing protein [Candidatus Deferrimicrobium sp.]|nr:SPASM domain-containing protein [Candidatus Kapabacteria bacterium]HLP61426.1 SPASM domain-containing protein [Candidatus Deferrimicrobium sp.]